MPASESHGGHCPRRSRPADPAANPPGASPATERFTEQCRYQTGQFPDIQLLLPGFNRWAKTSQFNQECSSTPRASARHRRNSRLTRSTAQLHRLLFAFSGTVSLVPASATQATSHGFSLFYYGHRPDRRGGTVQVNEVGRLSTTSSTRPGGERRSDPELSSSFRGSTRRTPLVVMRCSSIAAQLR